MAHSDDIRSLLEELQRLQQLLGDLHGRLRRGPLIIQAQTKMLDQSKEKLEKTREEHQKLLLYAKEKERQMVAAEAALEKRKTQMNEAKTNKEFQALKSQVAADEVANSVLADEVLEAMEKTEKFAPKVDEAEAEWKKAGELLEATQKNTAQEQPVIKADIARLTEELQANEKRLPGDFHEVYGRLIKHLGGHEAIAVVVKNKYCGSCNQLIPINSLARILQQKPVTCSCCARLLYVPKDFEFEKG